MIPDALSNGGRVTLVGSGPGDPDLLTVSAYKLLTENPDALVIADRLVSPEILNLIPGDIKTARKLPGCAELAQQEIYWWAYQALNQGRHVIRLKIGDPFVFGRGGEEVLTFRRFGVQPKVIPVRLDHDGLEIICVFCCWMNACMLLMNLVFLVCQPTAGSLCGLCSSAPGIYPCDPPWLVSCSRQKLLPVFFGTNNEVPHRLSFSLSGNLSFLFCCLFFLCTQRQPSGHVHRLRARQFVSRLDSVS